MNAYSRIQIAPDPADTGVSLEVLQDEGVRFDDPLPFQALVWPIQALPTPDNSEQLTVIDVEGDVFTLIRAASPIEVTSGLMIASLGSIPVYPLDSPISLKATFPVNDTGVALWLRNSQGEVGGYGTASSPSTVVNEGGGVYRFDFDPLDSGLWSARWESEQRVVYDGHFFVRFSPTLD